MILCTVGYEGKTIENFVDELKSHNIAVLADVRELPLSRKPGFSKTAIQKALAEAGIDYIHFRTLGTPRDMRHALRETRDYVRFFERYRLHLDTQEDALQHLIDVASERKTCLMCFEKDPEQCHRSVLVDRLRAETTDIHHL